MNNKNPVNNESLKAAITHAQAGDWALAHKIVQEFDDSIACWIHAVLHKIEGDESNSRYWYARTNRKYEDFTDPGEELIVIRQQIV
jgi:IS1 family transposase